MAELTIKQKLKGMTQWAVINGLYLWAVVAACIFASDIGYNFMAWSTYVMCGISVLGYFGTLSIKEDSPERFEKMRSKYLNSWHVNKMVDFLYDVAIMGMMVYAGYLFVATAYLISMLFLGMYVLEMKTSDTSVEAILNEYDESIFNRMGITRDRENREDD